MQPGGQREDGLQMEVVAEEHAAWVGGAALAPGVWEEVFWVAVRT